jgi:hypothetical protein
MSEKGDRGNNNKLDKHVQEMGFCCTAGYIKLHVAPTDTIARLARKAMVSVACMKNNRRALREGKLLCQNRPRCLAALFLAQEAPVQRKWLPGEGPERNMAEGCTCPPFLKNPECKMHGFIK